MVAVALAALLAAVAASPAGIASLFDQLGMRFRNFIETSMAHDAQGVARLLVGLNLNFGDRDRANGVKEFWK